jgi:hypothetical protein
MNKAKKLIRIIEEEDSVCIFDFSGYTEGPGHFPVQIYSKAAQIIDAIDEVGSQASIEQVSSVVKEVLDSYFKEHNLPVPEINVRNFTNVGWLGQMRTRLTKTVFDPDIKVFHTLEVQKSILNDPETLRRVVAHEMIHLWQNATQPADKLYMIVKYGLDPSGGHGQDFLDYAAKINAMVGSEYITPKSDETYKVALENEYYILIEPVKEEQNLHVKFGWSIAVRPSVKQREEIIRRMVQHQARLFKTKNPIFLGGAPLKMFGGFSYAPLGKAGSDEKNAELERLYNSGQRIASIDKEQA